MDCCSISTLLYGQQLISGDMRRTVEHFIEDTHLCSAEGRGSIHEFVDLDLPQTVTSTISIAVSPDGHTFASTHGDHSVRVFQCLTGALVRTFTGHPRTPWTVKYHPINSNVIASGCLGYQVLAYCTAVVPLVLFDAILHCPLLLIDRFGCGTSGRIAV